MAMQIEEESDFPFLLDWIYKILDCLNLWEEFKI